MENGTMASPKQRKSKLVEFLTTPRGIVGKVRKAREVLEKKVDGLQEYASVNHEETWFEKSCKGEFRDDG